MYLFLTQTVFAYRSKDAVTILKDWGTNVGKRNCIIIFSGEDDVYLCDEDVFKATYEKLDSGEGDEDGPALLEGGAAASASAIIAAAAAATNNSNKMTVVETKETALGPASPSHGNGSLIVVSASASASSAAAEAAAAAAAAGLVPVDPMHGTHEWRKTGTVLARCMEEAFSVRTDGGSEHGMAGDYLVQNAQGDQWSIEAKTFLELYERWD